MPRLTQLTATSSFVLLFGAPMALADLSANDIWDNWKDYLSGFGYSVSGLERDTGSGLEVSDFKLTMQIPDDEGSFTFDMGAISFIETADGTVRIDMGDVLNIGFTLDPRLGDTVKGTMVVSQTDYALLASGTLEDIKYTYDAGSLNLKMKDFEGAEETMGIDMTMREISSVTSVAGTDLRTFDQKMSIGALIYAVDTASPDGVDTLQMRVDSKDLRFAANGQLPAELDTNNARDMIAAGLKIDGGYTMGGGSSEVTFKGRDGNGTINTTGTGGTFDFSLSDAGFKYGIDQTGVTINSLISTFPLPMTFTSDSIAVNVLAPTLKKPAAQDLGMLISLEGFTMSDALWGIFDPTAQLPRDPATITANLTGTAKLLFDYLDPTQATLLEQTGAPPGELESLSLKTLIVDAVGARLTGTGDFTFDNSDTVTFNGMPRPEGAIDLQLKGANGLLDKLVTIGLLPQDQAMGARMMMGLFARPGEGEDSLVSKIEVNDQGHVLANGQRIQ